MEETGMTNAQYKGLLLDELEDWEEILALAQEEKNPSIICRAERHIQKIQEKLKFLRTGRMNVERMDMEAERIFLSYCRQLLRGLCRIEAHLDAGEIEAARVLLKELREDTEKDMEG